MMRFSLQAPTRGSDKTAKICFLRSLVLNDAFLITIGWRCNAVTDRIRGTENELWVHGNLHVYLDRHDAANMCFLLSVSYKTKYKKRKYSNFMEQVDCTVSFNK